MNNTQLYLFYAAENTALGEELKNYLQKFPLSIAENVDNEALDKALKIDKKIKILVLISDDFLKNVTTMRFALWLSQAEIRPQVLPVLLYNKRQKTGSSEYEWQPTQIYTVPDTVHYRDFWYEEWIRLRKKLNVCPESEKAQLEADVAVAKKLQPAMNAVLGKFRDYQPISYLKLQNDEHALLWDRLKIDFSQTAATIETVEIETAPIIETRKMETAPIIETRKMETAPIIETEKIEAAPIIETEKIEAAPIIETREIETAPIIETREIETAPIIETREMEAAPIIETEKMEETPIIETEKMEETQPEVQPEKLENVVENITIETVEIEETEAERLEKAEIEIMEQQLKLLEDLTVQMRIMAEGQVEIIENLTAANTTVESKSIENIEPETHTELVENTNAIIDQEIQKLEIALQKMEEFEQSEKAANLNPNLKPKNSLETSQQEPVMEQKIKEFSLDLAAMPDDFDEKLVYENYQIGELTDLDVLFCLAETETEEGDFAHAKNCYERILQLDPQNGRALIWLARLQHRFLSNPKAAEITYKKAILCSDESANLYYEYALLQAELGTHRRAVENLHQALEIQPAHAQVYEALARSSAALNQTDLAKMYYLQACVLNETLQTEKADNLYKILRPQPREIEKVPTTAVNNEFETKLLADSEEQRTVLVTGATSGIGQAVAEIFALQGFKLIIAGRREEYLLRWQESLEQRFNAKIYPLHIDVSDGQSVENAFLSLPEEFRNVDILINNAGLAKGFEPIQEGKISQWNQMIDTNLKGALYMINKVAAGMVARRKGHIINVGSAAAKQVYAKGAVYCATKAAIDALTAAMRLDLYPHNVRVSVVHPGAVEDTEFSLVRYEDAEKAKIYDKFKPLAAYDVAEMIYYMATRPAYVNVQEVLMFATQQGSTYAIDQSGRGDK